MLVRLKRTICLYFTGIIYNTGMLVRWCTQALRTQITYKNVMIQLKISESELN